MDLHLTEDMMRHHHDMVFPHTKGGYWALIPCDSARRPFLIFRTSWIVLPAYRLFAMEMSKVLNAQVSFDGIWTVVWTDWSIIQRGPARLMFCFFDEDFDLWFIVDVTDPLAVMVQNPLAYVQQCAQAHARYLERMKQLELQPNQIIRAARGQRTADDSDGPDLVPWRFD